MFEVTQYTLIGDCAKWYDFKCIDLCDLRFFTRPSLQLRNRVADAVHDQSGQTRGKISVRGSTKRAVTYFTSDPTNRMRNY